MGTLLAGLIGLVIWLFFHVVCPVFTMAFIALVIWVFSGKQGQLIVTKRLKILGMIIDYKSEKPNSSSKGDIEIKIKR